MGAGLKHLADAGTVGYVGLGSMGGALALRLLQSTSLQVYDMDERARMRLADAGATACESLGALAQACDLVLLCLPTSAHVRTALFGHGGLAAGLKPGTIVVDQSTGDPVATRAMARELAGQGVALVDAPVSGGTQGAQAGTIAIMVGAGEADFERVAPVLRAISCKVFRAGDVGAGQVMKLVNNMLSAAQRLLTFEAMALAAKNGIVPLTASEILRAGGARNVFMESFLSTHILQGNLWSGFTLGLMLKDVRLACQLASDSGVPMFFGNLTGELYQMCVAEQGADAQVHTAALVVDRLAGTRMVPVPAASPTTEAGAHPGPPLHLQGGAVPTT